jgi:hypothetical protein
VGHLLWLIAAKGSAIQASWRTEASLPMFQFFLWGLLQIDCYIRVLLVGLTPFAAIVTVRQPVLALVQSRRNGTMLVSAKAGVRRRLLTLGESPPHEDCRVRALDPVGRIPMGEWV